MVLSIQYPPGFASRTIPPQNNKLLSLLPPPELQKLLVDSERIVVPEKTILYKPRENINQVYFPIRGVISLVNIDKAGLIAEYAMVSNEGMIDVGAILGRNFSSSFAIAHIDCVVISLGVDVLKQEFTSGKLQRLLLLYSQALSEQIAQNVFCSCHHTLEQRLARWLLSYSDRLQTTELSLTQETLADLIGVRRASLSIIAGNLRQRHLINYNRGKIAILNPIALRQVACKCDLQATRSMVSQTQQDK